MQAAPIAENKRWKFSATLVKREEVAKETFLYTFELSEKFDYIPGQYVWVVVPALSKKVGIKDREAFSIVTVDGDTNNISILFRASTSPYKRELVSSKIKSSFEILGPFGFSFCIPDNFKKPLVLIAGGVGVAPFITLGKHLKSKQADFSLNIALFNRDKESAVLVDEVKSLESDYKNCNVFSKIGRPEAADFGSIVSNDKDAVYYISGTQEFVDSVYKFLSMLHIPLGNVRFENYYPTHPSSAILQVLFKAEGKDSSEHAEGNELVSSNILKLAIQSASNHVIITDVNGQIIFANKAAETITGYSFAEMEGNTPRLWGGLMPPDFYVNLWKNKLSGNSVDSKIVNRKKNGEVYSSIAHVSPIKNDDGSILGWIATEEDISDIEKAEKVIQERTQEINTFFETSQDIMIIANTNGYFEKLNPAITKILGYTSEELTKNPFLTFVHPEDKAMTMAEIEKLSTGVLTINFTNRYQTKDGKSVWLQWNATPLGTQLYAIARDITEMKEKEAEMQKLNTYMVGRELRMVELKEKMAEVVKRNESQSNSINKRDRASREAFVQTSDIQQIRSQIADLLTTAKDDNAKLFKMIADYTYDWEILLLPDTSIGWMNKAVERVTGYSDKDLTDLDAIVSKCLEGDEGERFKAMLIDSMAKRSIVNDQVFSLKHREGKGVWAAISWQPAYVEGGAFSGVRISVRTTDDRKGHEDELERKISELSRLTALMVERELKMVELKEAIKVNSHKN